MSIRSRWLVISSFFLPLSRDSFTIFSSSILSLPSSHIWCHRCSYCSMEHSTVEIEVAPDTDSSSSSFYRPIHLRFFIFSRWSDTWGHHGIACVHGCSPWHTQWWVVSGEHPCRSNCAMTGYHGWFHNGFWKLLRKQYKTKIIFSFKDCCTTQPWILNRIKLRTSLSNPSVLPPKVFTSLSLYK